MSFVTRPWLEAALLAAAAGVVDAVGYLQAGIFVANMTGNTVLVGISVGEGHWTAALYRAVALLSFFLGAAFGYVLRRQAGPNRRWPLVAEALILALAAMPVFSTGIAVNMVAFAMGLQATAVTVFGGVALSTVVLTSTMARIAEGVVQRVLPDKASKAPSIESSRLLLCTWFAYASGAVVGTVVFRWVGNGGLFLSSVLVITSVLVVKLGQAATSAVRDS